MRSSSFKFKSSLVNRIIVVSRKPHGNSRAVRPRVHKCRVLPVATTDDASDVIEFVSCSVWPQRYVWHTISSLSASDRLQTISQDQLARICELVNICNYNGETSDCGALEGDREMEGGIIRNGSVIEERREERDGCRVKCLSALIPVLASHPTLHHMALSALTEVIVSRGGITSDCEHSLLYTCGDNYTKLIHLAKLARSHGHRFSRSFYRGVLSKILHPQNSSADTPTSISSTGSTEIVVTEQCLTHYPLDDITNTSNSRETVVTTANESSSSSNSRGTVVTTANESSSSCNSRETVVTTNNSREGVVENEDIVPPEAGELVAMMSGDWDKSVVEADMFWLALHLASEEGQVKAICDEMNTSQHISDESVSIELVHACLRTAHKLEHDNHQHNGQAADPSHAVSTLVAHLPSRQASVSSLAFEKVFIACADSLQLKLAFDAFLCMTHTHNLAPTRAGLQGLGRLLCSPLLTTNTQWRQLRLAFASCILEASVAKFNEATPSWVYSECSRPLTQLLGSRGYYLTYDLCMEAAIREHGELEAAVTMDELWDRELYHSILQTCSINHGPQLATFLLNHMTFRGIPPNESTFHHLLKFPVSHSDIGDYMAVLARHMHYLSSEERCNLVRPLHTMLLSTLPPSRQESSCDEMVYSTVLQLLEAMSDNTGTEQQCISQLSSLSGVSLAPSLETNNAPPLDCSSVSYSNRAIA